MGEPQMPKARVRAFFGSLPTVPSLAGAAVTVTQAACKDRFFLPDLFYREKKLTGGFGNRQIKMQLSKYTSEQHLMTINWSLSLSQYNCMMNMICTTWGIHSVSSI